MSTLQTRWDTDRVLALGSVQFLSTAKVTIFDCTNRFKQQQSTAGAPTAPSALTVAPMAPSVCPHAPGRQPDGPTTNQTTRRQSQPTEQQRSIVAIVAIVVRRSSFVVRRSSFVVRRRRKLARSALTRSPNTPRSWRRQLRFSHSKRSPFTHIKSTSRAGIFELSVGMVGVQ